MDNQNNKGGVVVKNLRIRSMSTPRLTYSIMRFATPEGVFDWEILIENGVKCTVTRRIFGPVIAEFALRRKLIGGRDSHVTAFKRWICERK
jgi:hypothetical protein